MPPAQGAKQSRPEFSHDKHDKHDNPLIYSVGLPPTLLDALHRLGYRVENFSDNREITLSSERGLPRLFIVRSTAVFDIPTEAFIKRIKGVWPIVDLVLWSPRCSAELAVNAMKSGARDVILEDANDVVIHTVDHILNSQQILPAMSKKSRSRLGYKFEGILSRDPKMWDIFDDIERIANTDTTILILGETGTGKELLARAIHRKSKRLGRFVAINCAAIPENLIDSELFGHVRGAFTGAEASKKGLFRYADEGTILLDEIGNMPLSAQYHLLRVLQESKIRPVGGHEEVDINTRVIAATSTPLVELMAAGRFREDLFYRLDVMRLDIPALRRRREDIVFLFSHFVKSLTKQHDRQFPQLSDAFLEMLTEYDWPGNVRQLINVAERLVLTAKSNKLTVAQLKKIIAPNPSAGDPPSQSTGGFAINTDLPLKQALDPQIDEWERHYFIKLLNSYQGQLQKVATHAGINRRTLYRKMSAWDLHGRDFKKSDSQDP